MNKILSVIIPFYNAEKFLNRTLNSLFLKDIDSRLFEIILINDGSTDGSRAICERFLKIKENIIYLESSNFGVSSARNKGIEVAQGEYIVFVDADDYVCEEYISTILDKCTCADFVIFDNFIDNNKFLTKEKRWLKNRYGNALKEDVITWICKNLLNAPWDKIFKTDIIKKNNIRFIEGLNLGEDVIFNLEYIFYCNKIYISSNSIYIHTINDNSLTKININEKKYEQYNFIYNRMIELLKQLDTKRIYKKELNKAYLKILYIYIKQLYNNGYSKNQIVSILRLYPIYSIIIREHYINPLLVFRKYILKYRIYWLSKFF